MARIPYFIDFFANLGMAVENRRHDSAPRNFQVSREESPVVRLSDWTACCGCISIAARKVTA
jgi:hypothetical protein